MPHNPAANGLLAGRRHGGGIASVLVATGGRGCFRHARKRHDAAITEPDSGRLHFAHAAAVDGIYQLPQPAQAAAVEAEDQPRQRRQFGLVFFLGQGRPSGEFARRSGCRRTRSLIAASNSSAGPSRLAAAPACSSRTACCGRRGRTAGSRARPRPPCRSVCRATRSSGEIMPCPSSRRSTNSLKVLPELPARRVEKHDRHHVALAGLQQREHFQTLRRACRIRRAAGRRRRTL